MKRIVLNFLSIIICSFLLVSIVFSADNSVVMQVQQRLNEEGYDCGTADGIAGSMTAAAISAFQEAHGMTVDGQISDALLEALQLSGSRCCISLSYRNS